MFAFASVSATQVTSALVRHRGDALRSNVAPRRGPGSTPFAVSSPDTSSQANVANENPGIPRGDTAGAMFVMRDVMLTVGDRDLLVAASMRVEPGEVVGLVGANGCGKSTLLRTVCGTRDVDGGVLCVAQSADVGYLEQTAVSGSRLTVAEEARSRMTHVRDVEQALKDAERGIENGVKGAEEIFLQAQARFTAVGGNSVERRVSDVLSGLGFAKEAWDRPCVSLSGGWQMRVALARLLLSPAGDTASSGITGGFLLLDEPTNHLDASAKEYLRGWLKGYKGTVLIVSHDEQLLETGVDRLVEVRGQKLHAYSGNYKRFLEERLERRKLAANSLEKETKKAAKLTDFVAKNSARASTAASAKSRAKQLVLVIENLEGLMEDAGGGGAVDENDTSGPGDAKKVVLKLPKPPACAKECLVLEKAAVGYDASAKALFTDASIVANLGDRILVVGPNGSGKSTLLKALAGGVRVRSGSLKHGEGVRVGYFSQDLAQELPGDEQPLMHVLRVARAADPTVTAQTARSVLGALGLTGNTAVDRKISDLSGGEKARVALAAFVLRPVNVLLLDEASNHLDAAALDALTEALRGWDGAVIAVTHNKQFAEALEPTTVVRVEAGKVTSRMTSGALSKKDFSPSAAQTGGVAGAEVEEVKGSADSFESAQAIAEAEQQTKDEKAKRDKTLKEARNAPGVIEKIEKALAVIEKDVEQIDAKFVKCGADVAAAQEVQKERDAKTNKADLYYAEWERLEEVMAEAEAIVAAEAA